MLRNIIFNSNNCIRHITVKNYNNIINCSFNKNYLRHRTNASAIKPASKFNDLKYSQEESDKILETINSSDINNLSR